MDIAEESRRNQCKLWIAATAPLVLLVLTVITLLQLNIRWFNISVTSPFIVALAFASIGYVVHKRPIIEIDFYIPGSRARKRKTSFYHQLSDLERDVVRIPSLQEVVDRVSDVLRCPIALVTIFGLSLKSQGAPEKLLKLSAAELTGIDRFTARDAEISSRAIYGLLLKSRTEAVIPFFPHASSLSFWLLCGEPFNRQIYSARDYKLFKGIIEKLAGLLLEKMIQGGANIPSQDPHVIKPLQQRIEELEANCIRTALALAKGNKAEAARLLGLKPNTLHYKLRRYQI